MSRALRSRVLAGLAAVAAAAALLVVPALHGALAHAPASCAPAPAGCEVAAGDAALGSAPGALACPLCLASSQARTLLIGGDAQAPVAAGSSVAPLRLPAPPPLPTPLARAVSAPRAPPHSA